MFNATCTDWNAENYLFIYLFLQILSVDNI